MKDLLETDPEVENSISVRHLLYMPSVAILIDYEALSEKSGIGVYKVSLQIKTSAFAIVNICKRQYDSTANTSLNEPLLPPLCSHLRQTKSF